VRAGQHQVEDQEHEPLRLGGDRAQAVAQPGGVVPRRAQVVDDLRAELLVVLDQQDPLVHAALLPPRRGQSTQRASARKLAIP
jgi:hypothetical protein